MGPWPIFFAQITELVVLHNLHSSMDGTTPAFFSIYCVKYVIIEKYIVDCLQSMIPIIFPVNFSNY